MTVDTYLIARASDPEAARDEFDPEHAETTRLGRDWISVFIPTAWVEIQRDPAHWGRELTRGVSRRVRAALDARGLAAYPEVGQSFEAPTFEALISLQGAPLWLPIAERRMRRSREPRVLLVPASTKRASLLRANPTLPRDIIDEHRVTPMVGAHEIEKWVALQRALFDAAAPGLAGETHNAAVWPTGGLPLYEDATIDAAKLFSAEDVAVIAGWLATLPSAALTTAAQSPRARAFPASLGTVPADDEVPSRRSRKVREVTVAELDEALTALARFYGGCASRGDGVLAIRYR